MGQAECLFKKNGKWGVRIKLPVTYGKYEYKRIIGKKAEAIEDRDRVKKLIRLRKPLDEAPAPAFARIGTLGTFIDEAARAWKPRDPRHTYAKLWKAWAGEVPIDHVTRPRLQEAVNELERAGYSGATIRIAVVAIKAAFNLADDTRQLEHNPLAKPLKLPPANKRKRYVPLEGLFRLMAVMERYGVLAEFAVLTGLRCSELLGLTWPDITDDYLEILKTKQGKPHLVYLSRRLAELLALQRGQHPVWVFPSPTGGRWNYASFSKKRRSWFTEAGLEGFVWHDLRHTAASYALSSGEPLASVGHLLGHGVGSPHTQRYAHLLPHAAQRVPETIATFMYPAVKGRESPVLC